MTTSELAVAEVRRYCEGRVPRHLRDQIRLDVETRGAAITIVECRPPWRPDLGPEWTRMKIAQFRFDAKSGTWSLFWCRASGRWLRYEGADPSPDPGDLLGAIEEDPDGVFWG